MKNKYGGINDAKVDKRVYGLWYQMLRRCYDREQMERKQGRTYSDCYVCDRWFRLSNFAADIKKLDGYTDWETKVGYCLDKDIRVPGNKVYSPSTCIFVPYIENIREANKRTQSIKAAQESRKTVYYLEKEGVTLVFESESAACKYLGVKKCSVSSCRRRNLRCKGYTVSCAKMDAKDMDVPTKDGGAE